MEAAVGATSGSKRARVVGLAISPYLIVANMALAVAGLATFAAHKTLLWLGLVAVAGGWSSAWSP